MSVPRASRTAPQLLFLLGCALARGTPLAAEPTRVEIEWRDRSPSAHAQVRVCAVRRATPNLAAARCDADVVTGTGETTLDLAAGGWSLRAQVDGFWSTQADVDVVPGAGGVARIALWPSATLSGTFVRVGDAPPAFAELRFATSAVAAPDGGQGRAPGPSGTLFCPVQNDRWSCSLPAGTLDVELRAEAFVPHYLWEVALTAGRETALPALGLRRGASIAGRIVRANGSIPLGPCHAQVEPAPPPGVAGTPESAPQPPGATKLVTPIGPHGFFQLAGVPAGERLLAVECPVVHALRAVTVRPDSETRLAEPLVVEGLALEVQVIPPYDPLQRPWRLDVFRFTAERQQLAARVPVSPEGRWSHRNLASDTYQVDVVDETGAQWQSQPRVLTETSAPLVIQVPTLKIAGRVRLASTPLRAQVIFMNDAGSMRLSLQSDDEGLFQGFVVSSSEAWERGWAVQIHATAPPVNHRLENVVLGAAPGAAEVWLDLTVPGASARGTVVSESGEPQPGAQVLSASLDDAAATYASTTDEHGAFELLELPPGRYRVTAETESALSAPQELDVAEGSEQELRLVLAPQTRLEGQVVSAAGVVPGATVHLWLAPGLPRGSTTTDDEGRFEIGLPADAQEAALTVAARGYALHMRRVRVDPQAPLSIALDTRGGTLVLSQPPKSEQNPPTSVLLVHNDALESLDTVSEWGVQNGGGPEGERVIVPAVEPGVYSLCRVPASEVAALWSGSAAQAACGSASLAVGAVLQLSEVHGREGP